MKLYALQPLLSRRDEEAFAILMDKQLMPLLEKSLREADADDVEPLENILK